MGLAEAAIGRFDWADPFALDAQLSDEERLVRDTAAGYAQEKLQPRVTSAFLDERFDREIMSEMGALGLLGSTIPPEYGGAGLNYVSYGLVAREVERVDSGYRSAMSVQSSLVMHPIHAYGSEEQRRKYLPKLASGEWVGCFGLTEPDAGSDPGSLTTRADRRGDDWVINGAKRYITNAPVADLIMVFARTTPDVSPSKGVSVFMVPTDAPGLTIGQKDRKMGQAGAWSADVHLDDVRVPHSAMVGEQEGAGYVTAMRSLAHGRLHIAALCVGMAQRLVHESVEYAQHREQGGKPIADFQLIQALLADSQTDTMAARALVLDAAAKFDAGLDTKMGPAASKYFASEAVGRVADRAVQIHGGAGYMRGVAVERFYRDARLFRIYEGTSQIQQLVIARQLLAAHAKEA